jgi:Protein of unknown function (DUF3667)
MRYRCAMVDPAQAGAPCPNCAQPLSQPPLRFCPHCGQETRVRAPTLMEFAQQFGGAYFATEGALWRTFKLLVLRPGELTRQYLAGRRKHYVLPLRLFLTVSVVVLLAIRLLAQSGLGSPLQVDVDLDLDPTHKRSTFSLDLGSGRAGMKDGVFYCTGLPQWVCQRLQRRIDVDPKALQQEMLRLGERMLAQLGSAMFVLLPTFAMWLKLVWIDRRLRYTEHLVFALHLHAFWFLALALALPGVQWLTFVAFVSMPLYAMAAFKRVYGGGFWSRLLRAGLIGTLYLLTLALVMVGVALWALLA